MEKTEGKGEDDEGEKEEKTGRMYFPVCGVRIDDLHDWCLPASSGQVTVASVTRRYQRQRSRTGSLVVVNAAKVALFRYGGKVYAINEKCPHAGGPLHIGDIENLPDNSLCVRCPWHSWKFRLDTGAVVHPKGRGVRATVYPVRVEADESLSVGFDQFDPSFFTGTLDEL